MLKRQPSGKGVVEDEKVCAQAAAREEKEGPGVGGLQLARTPDQEWKTVN